MSRSRRSRKQQRSNRSARILTTLFSIIIVLSFVLSLVGPEVFRGSADPTAFPTRVFPTPLPINSPTPFSSATPTAGIPTPVIVTPTPSQ